MVSNFAPTPLRRRLLAEALETDLVLTLPQAVHHFRLSEGQVLKDYPHRLVQYKPLSTSTRQLKTTFLARSKVDLRELPGWKLAHLAGTAQIRYLLGAGIKDWLPETAYGNHRPDALWRPSSDRVIAIEYDGGYAAEVVRQKMASFSDKFDGIIWGAPSSARLSHVRSRHAAPDRQFIVSDITQSIAARIRSSVTEGDEF